MNILGVDISTTTIGIAIVNENEKLLYYEYMKPKGNNFIEKADSVSLLIQNLFQKHEIDKVIIETPNVRFSPGKSSAQTIATILRFNGIITYILNLYSKTPSQEIFVTTARKKVTGRGMFPAGTAKKEVYLFLENKYKKQFPEFEKHKKGKEIGLPIKEAYDVCDAWILALNGL